MDWTVFLLCKLHMQIWAPVRLGSKKKAPAVRLAGAYDKCNFSKLARISRIVSVGTLLEGEEC